MIFSIPGAAENGMTLARFSAAFRAEMGTGLWMPAAMMLVLFIIGTVNTYLQLYMCMAIGGQWPTSRLGASIAAYFILNFGLQMLTVAGMLVSGVVLVATGAMDALVPVVEHAAPAAVMCAVMGAVGAVLMVMFLIRVLLDWKKFCNEMENPIMAIENLTATTLRNIIGELELDQTLTSREIINAKMRTSLDVATDPWGIKVNRVELKNIIPPAAIQDAMEKQMKAERERREAILRAEGEKKSTILVAEGKKASAILDAEAEKEAAILRAEAQKERMIREAEGQAEAILKVQQANADGLRFLKEAAPDQSVLQLKALDAFMKASDGKATKIIIPSEIQGMAGLVTSMAELAKKDQKEEPKA